MPVGLVPGVEFQATRLQLKPGDRLVLVTDGVTEAEDAEGEFFGMERLEKLQQRRVSRNRAGGHRFSWRYGIDRRLHDYRDDLSRGDVKIVSATD